MRRVEKFGVMLRIVGGIVVVVGIFYRFEVAGVSDIEQCTHDECHPLGWFIQQSLIGVAIFISGFGFLRASGKVMELSHKTFRRVWVRNLVSNTIKELMIEDGSNIVLSADEVIHKISRKVYYFR